MLRRAIMHVLAALFTLSPASVFAEGITLNWAANTEPDLAGYKIHYGLVSGSYTTVLDIGALTTATVTGLSAKSTYYFSVSAYDQDGNNSPSSIEVSLLIPQIDPNPPTVTAPADITVEASGPLTPVGLGTASATDLEDGIVGVSPSNTGPFAPGTHTIIWTATDAAGNVASATQLVTVVDTTRPTITANTLTVEATGTLTAVNLSQVSAVDLVDGAITATANDTGPFARGTHTITWTATDSHNNTSTAVQTINVVDTTPPVPPTGLTIQ